MLELLNCLAFSIWHSVYRGLAEMSGQALCFLMISSRRPDTGKCPRHI